ncbi:hypothetical protein [Parapedobacter tibetensis]|uniref:hypothetical protein n=1 Tax=Parapedobacter tibetensis TaxID=2972951 RepID=UPI00214D8208|nr:hypothetical protein [Parapedobacter tibetensis]
MRNALKFSLSIVTSFILLVGMSSWIGGVQNQDWYYNGTTAEDFFEAGNWDTTNEGGNCAIAVPRPCHLSIGPTEDLQDVLDSYGEDETALLEDAGMRATN